MKHAHKPGRRSLWSAGARDRFGSPFRYCGKDGKEVLTGLWSRKSVEPEMTSKAVPSDTAGKLLQRWRREGY